MIYCIFLNPYLSIDFKPILMFISCVNTNNSYNMAATIYLYFVARRTILAFLVLYFILFFFFIFLFGWFRFKLRFRFIVDL